MRKILIIFLLFFCSTIGFTQTVEQVLSLVSKEYSKKEYLQFSTKYNLYKNKENKKSYESYNGIFKKNKKNEIYQKIDQVEILWNNNYSLKVNHPDKYITLSLSQPVTTGEIDFKELADYCKIKSFKKNGNTWELQLEPQAFSSLPYSKIVITINSKYFITKQLFYYNTPIDFSSDYRNQKLDYPVLEIINSNFNRGVISDAYFNVKKYVTEVKNTIKVSNEFNTYTLEDLREISIK